MEAIETRRQEIGWYMKKIRSLGQEDKKQDGKQRKQKAIETRRQEIGWYTKKK